MTKGKTLLDNLYLPSLDSFKIRFPLDAVDIIDSRLYEHQTKYVVSTDTGLVFSEEPIQNNSLKVPFSNYHIHFRIEKIFDKEFLAILINSKLLEHQYMEGIHSGNIQSIYERINGCNVISLSYDDFLRGLITDIDIKKDITLSSDLFQETLPHLKDSTIPRVNQGQGVLSFNKKDNLGIQWNDRVHSTPTAPFLKFYHKGTEMLNSKNKDFFLQYVDVEKLLDVLRIETTIKNLKHLKAHKIASNELRYMMSLSHEELDSIIKYSVTSNLNARIEVKKPRDASKMTPTDSLIYSLMSHIINKNTASREDLFKIALSNIDCKKERYRQSKRLEKIYAEQIEGLEYEVRNRKKHIDNIPEISSFFKAIGWD